MFKMHPRILLSMIDHRILAIFGSPSIFWKKKNSLLLVRGTFEIWDCHLWIKSCSILWARLSQLPFQLARWHTWLSWTNNAKFCFFKLCPFSEAKLVCHFPPTWMISDISKNWKQVPNWFFIATTQWHKSLQFYSFGIVSWNMGRLEEKQKQVLKRLPS